MTDDLRQELRRHLIGIQTHVRGLEVAIERCESESENVARLEREADADDPK